MLGTAVAAALSDRGFVVRALPGHPVFFERDGLSIAPFQVLGDLADGTLSAESWRDQVERAGIADVDLGSRGRSR
jgi:hypothetical protein